MDIDRYYKSQHGVRYATPVTTPKIVIDMMLMDKYHWTPQQIDDIPKMYMDIMWLAMSQKTQSEGGVEQLENKATEFKKDFGLEYKPNKANIIGSGIREKRIIR